MHDLVHDLARIILGEELIVRDASEQIKWSEQHYSRHMRLVNYKKQSKALKEFPGKIRSLHFTDGSALQFQQKPFSKSKYLRVLDLSGCSIAGEPAPSSILLLSYIPQLVLLRYLDASGLPISALPKSLHKLQNMQTLILSNCTLETLPDDIGSLLNLGYCDLSGNSSLKKLPMSFGKLSALSFLKLSGCSKLEELPESFDDLKCLRHLDMSGCCALQKLPDKFGSFPKLLFLNLSGCSKLVKLPDNLNLESLEHLNLSSCHELQNLPQDFGNLDKLVFLNLSDCYKVQALPDSFCQLKHLKDLDLSDCHDLRELPGCFGNLSELQSLNLTSCSKLQSLPDSFSDLSKLKHLNLSYCVRIERLQSSLGKLMLQVLDVSTCWNLYILPDSIGSMRSLAQLRWNEHNKHLVSTNARKLRGRLGLPRSTTHPVHETDSGDCSILELGKSISQDLTVTNLKDVKCPDDAERAKLRDYPELRRLKLDFQGEKMAQPVLEHMVPPRTLEEFDFQGAETDAETDAEKAPFVLLDEFTFQGAETDAETDAEKAQLVLKNLVPPRTLEEFALFNYRSKDFPNWMLDISSYLPHLVSIELRDLAACDSLPPFGRLPNLRLLDLCSLPGIRRIGKEFYGEEGTCKKLRVIKLVSLENLDEWWTTRSGDEHGEFLIPNLHLLRVYDCPKLKFLPCPPKSMHWDLSASYEVLPERGFGWLPSSTLPSEANITNGDFSAAKWARLQHLAPTLETLVVWMSNSSMRTLPEVTPCFPSLRSLQLSLKDLEILPEWLGKLVSLEHLYIWESPNLTSLPESIQNLTDLKKLEIRHCPRLIERCRGEDVHKISHIPEIEFDSTIFTPGQPSEGREGWLKKKVAEFTARLT